MNLYPSITSIIILVLFLSPSTPTLNPLRNLCCILDDRIDMLHDGSLFIREVSEEDSLKWYKCVGTHSVTHSKVQSQTESVQMGPRGAQIILQGKELNLTE